jgi:hypothetical protein
MLVTNHASQTHYSHPDDFRRAEVTMSMITNETAKASLGTYFVQLFKVDADQFQLPPRSDRDCEFLNRPIRIERLDAPPLQVFGPASRMGNP